MPEKKKCKAIKRGNGYKKDNHKDIAKFDNKKNEGTLILK
tara:strand:+ start:642 stop:761 length:120 start_codon:yes stop_codon:yes gene_type:complete